MVKLKEQGRGRSFNSKQPRQESNVITNGRKPDTKDFEQKFTEKATSSESKRMTIQLGENLVRELQWLAESQGISQVDAIRKAIGTEFYFRQETDDGWKVVLQRDSELKEVVIL